MMNWLLILFLYAVGLVTGVVVGMILVSIGGGRNDKG